MRQAVDHPAIGLAKVVERAQEQIRLQALAIGVDRIEIP
jgi:hypothetical protein